MNLPGRPDHNWTWRFPEGTIDQWRVDWLAYLTAATARWKAPRRGRARDN